MECLHCRGQLTRATAPFTADRKGYHVTWDAIPAWVCGQCGEALFEAREVELIQKALAAVGRECETLAAATSGADGRG